MNQSRQIPFDLPVSSAEAREDLVVTPANAFAVEFLDSWPDWPSSLAILTGPPGSGKSHMARVWAATAEAVVVPAARLGETEPLADSIHNVVVEDAGNMALDETALFHLVNHVRAAGGYCLITSALSPSEWKIGLPDLWSRLRAAQPVELAEPDDDLLSQIMVKLFADRQIAVDPGVIAYVLARMERSLDAARRLVAEMDRESLARNRRVNRAVAAAALAKMGAS